jgi:hypothetical protein
MGNYVDLPREERVRELTADPALTPDDANKYADLFLQAGNYVVALMFLERSKDPRFLGRVRADAVQLGDAFLLHNVERLLPGSVDAASWRSCGERARKDGKLLFAREAYERAGDADLAREVHQDWLRIFPPRTAPAAPPHAHTH